MLPEIVVEGGVLIAGGDALIHDDAQRHHLLAEVSAHIVGHRLSHADEHAGGAEFVAVVVDVAGLDRRQIGDEQAGVERAQVDDLAGQQPVLVQMVRQPHHEFGQPGHGEHHPCELIGAVFLLRVSVGLDGIGDLLLDGEHGVAGLEIDLQRRLVRRAVRQLLQDNEGHAEVVAPVDVAVHHEVVQLGVGLYRLVVCGDDDGHVVDAHAAAALFADVGLNGLLVDVLGDGVPGIVSLGHDVGHRRYNGRQVFDSRSVRAHGQVLDSV